MIFSLILLAPSWGGMINGIMTLSGAWHKLREDPILKFLVVSLSFYGMSTFEGPMMSIKTVNSLSHYTDWTVGHVHSGALGWVAFISIGAMYYLVPRMFGKTAMWSMRLVSAHFWIATIGVVLYIAAMWIAGVMQGLMWRATNADGTLTYAFVEGVKATYPFYAIRLLGGTLFLAGMLVMAWNVWKTALGGRTPTRRSRPPPPTVSWPRPDAREREDMKLNQEIVEKNMAWMIALIIAVVAVGGLVEIVPLYFQKSTTEPVRGVKPYPALELAGRDVYLREGCYNCHSQMIRPFRAETERYGHYSVAGEFVYDHPFQWGSKRTGPDLARVGGRYSDEWHRAHLDNPRDVVPESNMPSYPWLAKSAIAPESMAPRMVALRRVGVPYSDDDIAKSADAVRGKSSRTRSSLTCRTSASRCAT
jgi:cytochrome c oxidase cbb3-type subunit I/II